MSPGDIEACRRDRISLSLDACDAWMPAAVPRRKRRSRPLCLKLRINAKCNLRRNRCQFKGFTDAGILDEKYQPSNPGTMSCFSQEHMTRRQWSYAQEDAIPSN